MFIITNVFVQEKDYLASGGVSVWTKLVQGRSLPVSSKPLLPLNTANSTFRVENTFFPDYRTRGL